jgi:hypothetical protein
VNIFELARSKQRELIYLVEKSQRKFLRRTPDQRLRVAIFLEKSYGVLLFLENLHCSSPSHLDIPGAHRK